MALETTTASATPDAPAPAELLRLVGADTLQYVQDRFAELGRMTVTVCAPGGALLTRTTWGSRYSWMIGASVPGRVEFAARLQECVDRLNEPELVRCLDGMTLYATPIRDDFNALAILVVGTRAHPAPGREACVQLAEKYSLDAEALYLEAKMINPLRGGSPESIRRFADTLASIIATLYRQARRIERQLADLNALHGLSQLLVGTRRLQEILDVTVRQVVEALPVKACGIRLLNEETGELVVRATCNLSDEYLRKGPVTLHDNAIDTAAFSGETVYVADLPSDPRTRYPENARREGIVSGLCAPMTYRGKTVGVIRVYTGVPYVFSEAEIALLRSMGTQAAAAIINGQLFEERARMEVVRRQVHNAAQIQRRMLPARLPQHPRLEFGCAYVPTLEVSGDFYDLIELNGGRWGLCVADVVGKGLPAALLMASVRSTLRAYAQTAPSIYETVALVNRQVARDTLVSEFTTMIYGAFSANGREFTYCSAGHPPSLLFRGDSMIELSTGGGIIGINPRETFVSEIVPLEPDDLLVFYTDGVTDALNFDGRNYGRDRFLASIQRHRNLKCEALAAQLLWDVRRYAGMAEQTDDITIVVVHVS